MLLRSIRKLSMLTSRYNSLARLLHWLMAILVIGQIILGYAADRAEGTLADMLLDRHVWVGLVILALVVMRLLWRLAHPSPALPITTPDWQRWAATGLHRLFYAILLVLPMSGYVLWAWIGSPLDWFGIVPIPLLFTGGDDETWRSISGYAYIFAGYALIAMIAGHIGAALWHELVLKDRLIRDRML